MWYYRFRVVWHLQDFIKTAVVSCDCGKLEPFSSFKLPFHVIVDVMIMAGYGDLIVKYHKYLQ